jgi:putative redox protein
MARATAHIATGDAYATTIKVAGRTLLADEPFSNGGKDVGLAPYDFLLSSLAACTAITLRMYIDHKGWTLRSLDVALHFFRDGDKEIIDRTVTLDGDFTPEQLERLAQVTERTPVTKTLKQGVTIDTTFA